MCFTEAVHVSESHYNALSCCVNLCLLPWQLQKLNLCLKNNTNYQEMGEVLHVYYIQGGPAKVRPTDIFEGNI